MAQDMYSRTWIIENSITILERYDNNIPFFIERIRTR